jgi:hypothetical protein
VAAWFASFIFWIQSVGQLFNKPAVIVPAVPRAYISGKKAA